MIRKAIKMHHALGVECLDCQNIDLICSRHHYASLMLMAVLLRKGPLLTHTDIYMSTHPKYITTCHHMLKPSLIQDIGPQKILPISATCIWIVILTSAIKFLFFVKDMKFMGGCNHAGPVAFAVFAQGQLTLPSSTTHFGSDIGCAASLRCPISNSSTKPLHMASQYNKVCMLGTYRLPVSPLFCCSILSLCQSSWEEVGRLRGEGGARNPLANDSWDLGHVLNLDTNVGSFFFSALL